MTERQYVYKITEVVKVTDGDTYWLRVDVGFRGTLLINVRLMGYDCPEARRGSEYERAQAVAARDAAETFLTRVTLDSWVRTEKDPDNFGRWLGHIWQEPEPGVVWPLGNWLRDLKLASVWPTRWREEFDK